MLAVEARFRALGDFRYPAFQQTRLTTTNLPPPSQSLPISLQFDFIDVHEFHANNCTTRLQYGWFWALFIKSIAVYVADIYTAVALFASGHWAASELTSDSGNSNVIEVPFSWVQLGDFGDRGMRSRSYPALSANALLGPPQDRKVDLFRMHPFLLFASGVSETWFGTGNSTLD